MCTSLFSYVSSVLLCITYVIVIAFKNKTKCVYVVYNFTIYLMIQVFDSNQVSQLIPVKEETATSQNKQEEHRL